MNTANFSPSFEELAEAARRNAERQKAKMQSPSIAITAKDEPAVDQIFEFLNCTDRRQAEGVLMLLKGSGTYIEIAQTSWGGKREVAYILNQHGLQQTAAPGRIREDFIREMHNPAYSQISVKDAVEAVEAYHHIKPASDAMYAIWMQIWTLATTALTTKEP